ncbi:DUF871 domain-containing protein [Mycoplasmopsis gallinacea]|uniref:DUF871 family protein n=1 Tax=Mycoplasmopsis gallinacea TaxID=29556 RepID=A0A6H0V425_9BACT|nr:MupG family TIM beta-alpha barrel fold protein [Mycoplasmopsis gallinacea]QIW62484.1 DUF871 family protein [Mycoplasmopsis gallinacea]
MLGVSIYPEKQDKKEILDYLEKAANYGFKRVFSCLLSVNGAKEEVVKSFKEINDFATSKGMEVILDVNPRVFDKLGVSYDNLALFKQMGATGIRLDLGFDGKKEAAMTYNKENLKIEINISNDNSYLENILAYLPNLDNLIASHNFYPQKYTGLSFEFFERITKKFKAHNIRTAAFVSSQNATVGPWELSHGLCSLELLRGKNVASQAKFLMNLGYIDDIIIGDSFASEKELKELSELQKGIVNFKVHLNESNLEIENIILLENEHFRRGDTNDYSIRSTQSRVKYKEAEIKQNTEQKVLKKGDVVICNKNYKQYKGELQIILKDQENVLLGKNVVARIDENDLFLIDHIKPFGRFTFGKKN